MNKWIVRMALLIGLTVLITACSENSSTEETGKDKQAEAVSAVPKEQQDAAGDTSAEPVDAAAEQKKDRVITDIAGWEHPVKAILQDKPYELSEVELSQDGTYPTFYVHYPNGGALKDSAAFQQVLMKIGKANGYWDFTLKNEQDNIAVQVHFDKTKKRLASILVNGETYELGQSNVKNGEVVRTANGVIVPRKYVDYLKNIKLDVQQLSFFQEADLDGDGVQEAIVRSDYNNNVYVMQVDAKGKVKQLGESISMGYEVYEVALVYLQDRPEPVIKLGLGMGSGWGFELVTLKDKVPEVLVYSASATGSGEDELVDSNHDGKIDGYTQARYSYDVLNYGVLRTFKLQHGGFQQVSTSVDPGEYPNTVKGVVGHYFALRMIDDGYSDKIKKRLKELFPSCTSRQKALLTTEWREAIAIESGGANAFFDEDSKFISDTQDKKKSTATVQLTYSGLNKLIIQLVLKDGKWTITDMK
ncbi:hypothetical protein PaecuDRAFT_1834 [Paenibacillus curdlanolyticus YK9]|uniref:Lipoprotein n=1 Tax=Paenibacillus curdlanolyticus YK9 TaxID=717606 RepID=E0I883_9BACL|nr:hypothetical protein [Paenibacillus curdlanolyticus]EFM11388.1 hypothetical protein PaecuDRAFT_1834 [Paenibacillus curdlanolyticus YK9]